MRQTVSNSSAAWPGCNTGRRNRESCSKFTYGFIAGIACACYFAGAQLELSSTGLLLIFTRDLPGGIYQDNLPGRFPRRPPETCPGAPLRGFSFLSFPSSPPTGPREARPDDRLRRGPISRSRSRDCGVWVHSASKTRPNALMVSLRSPGTTESLAARGLRHQCRDRGGEGTRCGRNPLDGQRGQTE